MSPAVGKGGGGSFPPALPTGRAAAPAAAAAKLRPLPLARPHRFRRIRALSATFSLVALAAVPLLGVARLDLAGGRHIALGAPAHWARAAVLASAATATFYGLTFLVNAIGGRLFCGFGCPLVYATRLDEAVRSAAAARDSARTRRMRLARVAYAIGFAGAFGLWLVDPASVLRGGAGTIAASAAALAAGALVVLLHGRLWGFGFCTSACPIGLYYTVVTPARAFGLRFDPAASPCIECGACDRVCPVTLAPRDLERPVERATGLAPEGAPGFNHCLTCGDCIEACEHATRKGREKRAAAGGPVEVAPLRFAWGGPSTPGHP